MKEILAGPCATIGRYVNEITCSPNVRVPSDDDCEVVPQLDIAYQNGHSMHTPSSGTISGYFAYGQHPSFHSCISAGSTTGPRRF